MDPRPGGLKNTIYEHQTRSGRRLSRGRMLLYKALVPLGAALLKLGWGWVRVVRVEGREHIDAALAKAPSFIPVYWHQHQLFCIHELKSHRARGLELGLLISPSVDGEAAAMLVRRMGGHVIRGSSTHTGARALRDYYQALVQDGISPVITPDGPKGPPWQFKPGAILLAQLSGRPMIPMSYAASRAWKIQWDRFVIPWPLARVAVVIGEPVYVGKGLDAAALERWQADMEQRLKGLFAQASSLLRER